MDKIPLKDLKSFLDEKAELYNHPRFIETDPIQIPHQFTKKDDIEISGFLTATIAWGNRKSIINNANSLVERMDKRPFEFISNASEQELCRFNNFVHRTFNGDDCVFFAHSLQNIYQYHNGLSGIFESNFAKTKNIFDTINLFREIFFSIPHLERTGKHVSNPAKNTSAKRINMFLRWMVRQDDKGVDFGLWKSIPSSALYIPLDVHTGNIARKLGILKRMQNDRKALEELMVVLRSFDPVDPVKYDFALFGIGAFENNQ